MAITSVQWQDKTKTQYIMTDNNNDTYFVPNDPLNIDSQAIEIWSQISGNIIQDPPVIAPSVPAEISARQFYQELSIEHPELITQDQAYAAATSGVLPDFIINIIKQIPQEEQFDAKMKIGSVVSLQRDNSTTNLFAKLMGWSSAQTDTFFTNAAALL